MDHPNNFRWPTEEDIAELNLKEPLRLKAIRTKGNIYQKHCCAI